MAGVREARWIKVRKERTNWLTHVVIFTIFKKQPAMGTQKSGSVRNIEKYTNVPFALVPWEIILQTSLRAITMSQMLRK